MPNVTLELYVRSLVARSPYGTGLSIRGSHPLHFIVWRKRILSADVAPIDHDAFAVLHRCAPDESAHRRLVIERAE